MASEDQDVLLAAALDELYRDPNFLQSLVDPLTIPTSESAHSTSVGHLLTPTLPTTQTMSSFQGVRIPLEPRRQRKPRCRNVCFWSEPKL